MDRGAWKATVHGVEKNQTQLSDCHFHHVLFIYQWMGILVVSTLRVFNTIINICIQAFFFV